MKYIFRLCSEHFTPDCYVTNTSKKILRDDALPSIFPNKGVMATLLSRRGHREFAKNSSNLNTTMSSNIVPTSSMKHVNCGAGSLAQCHGIALQILNAEENDSDVMGASTLDSADTEKSNPIAEETLGCTNPTAEDHPQVSERKFVVFESCLDKILKQLSCSCGEKICALHKVVKGAYLRVTGMCTCGHKSLTWENQPIMARENHLGNVSSEGISQCNRDASGKKNIPDRCASPLHCRDSTKEHYNFTCSSQSDDLNIIKVEDEEEEISPDIRPNPENIGGSQKNISVEDEEEGLENVKEEEMSPHINTDTRDVKAEEEEEECVRIKEEEDPIEICTCAVNNRHSAERCPSLQNSTDFIQEQNEIPQYIREKTKVGVTYVKGDEACNKNSPPQIGKDGQYRRYSTDKQPTLSQDGETEDDDITSHSSRDDITSDSSEENPSTQNHNLVIPRTSVSSNGGCSLDQPHPISSHTFGVNGELFSCSKCGKCFTQRADLIEHQRSHGVVKSFSCSECGKCFTKKRYLIEHQNIHTGENLFSCSECGKCFTRKGKLIVHQRSHTGEKPFSCPECGKFFSQKATLIKHERVHTGEKPYSCLECGKCFTGKDILITHQRIHRGEKPFTCLECGKGFRQKSDLTRHCRNHTAEKQYSCATCGKSFPEKSLLVIHERVHTGEKPFSCSECGKCFSQRGSLISHERIHVPEKPFSCSECGKCFTQKQNLIAHQRTHTAEKPFFCSECGKSFTQRVNLISHQRLHTGERPFSCSECGKSYTNRSHLATHQIVHMSDNPYSCTQCGKCFTRRGSLIQHQRSHTGEKPFSCLECGKTFTRKTSLMSHLGSHRLQEVPVSHMAAE